MPIAIVGTDAVLEEYQAAISKAEGLPRRGVVVGGPDYLPQTYSPGAPGWTDRIARVIDTNDGKRALEVPSFARRHLGKKVRVGAKDVDLPAASSLVDVTAKPDGLSTP